MHPSQVSHNKLSSLHGLSGSPTLRELWISHNQIAIPQLPELSQLTNLEVLVMCHNLCEQVLGNASVHPLN